MRTSDHHTLQAHLARAEQHLSSVRVGLAHGAHETELTADQRDELQTATAAVSAVLHEVRERLAGSTIDLELFELVSGHDRGGNAGWSDRPPAG